MTLIEMGRSMLRLEGAVNTLVTKVDTALLTQAVNATKMDALTDDDMKTIPIVPLVNVQRLLDDARDHSYRAYMGATLLGRGWAGMVEHKPIPGCECRGCMPRGGA